MLTEIKVIHAKDFVAAKPNGEFDLNRSKSLLMQIASTARSLRDYVVLLDTRNAESKLAAIDLWYLAAELQKLEDTFLRKTAVICPSRRLSRAKFFALCATNKGFPVRVFTRFEEAMQWLTSRDEPALSRLDGGPAPRAEAIQRSTKTGERV
jgi:hypothetical protein